MLLSTSTTTEPVQGWRITPASRPCGSALGDPPAGEWRHIGITRRFCAGQWAAPPIAPTGLAALYRRLLALYELRLDAHYRAQPVRPQPAQQGLDTVVEVFQVVQQYKRLEENA